MNVWQAAGPRRTQTTLEYVPPDLEVLGSCCADMRLLEQQLSPSNTAAFDDASWLRVNEAYRCVMLELFMALGRAQQGWLTDQRLPAEHARALLLLARLVEGSRQAKDAAPAGGRGAREVPGSLYTVLKFIVKKEGLPPLARRIEESKSVPVFARRRDMTKACQAIERCLSATIVVLTTLFLLLLYDANSQARGLAGSKREQAPARNHALHPHARTAHAFLATIRPAAEHLHVFDKHPALLLCSRAFFTPGWGDKGSRAVAGSVFTAATGACFGAADEQLKVLSSHASKASKHVNHRFNHAAKSLLPLLEIPARHCLVSEDKALAVGGETGVSTEIAHLLARILALPNGQDLLRALQVWALELLSVSITRPGILPPMHPAITTSQNAEIVLSNYKAFVDGKKADRAGAAHDVCLVGRLALLMAREVKRDRRPRPEIDADVSGGGSREGGELLQGQDLSEVLQLLACIAPRAVSEKLRGSRNVFLFRVALHS